jgi:hypothetical protein
LASGRFEDALAACERVLEGRPGLPLNHGAVRRALVVAFDGAFALGDVARVEELLASLDGERPADIRPYIRAHAARFGARLAWVTGERERVEMGFKNAAGMFREIGLPFEMAMVLLEHGEWLVQQGRADEAAPLLGESRKIFEGLEASPWLERVRRSESAVAGASV